MHELELTHALRSLVALLAIVNPLGAIPLFVAMTDGQSPLQRRHTSRVTSIAVAITLLIAAFLGRWILALFGIDLNAFRVGGGLLILMMAIQMLQGRPNRTRQTSEETEEGVEKDDVAVVPLAIPLLAGPGSLSAV
ncbi:MAG TPA: NAAT family transporter, partial [Mizugakiibacter sp.]|nr:NAAT family transporter [Mizugakiibacter sp.]